MVYTAIKSMTVAGLRIETLTTIAIVRLVIVKIVFVNDGS